MEDAKRALLRQMANAKMKHYVEGGLVSRDEKPDQIEPQNPLASLTAQQPKLTEDEFTKPGEMIPREGGIGNFVKYNLAHRDPMEDAASMGMAAGTISKAAIPALEKIAMKAAPEIMGGGEKIAEIVNRTLREKGPQEARRIYELLTQKAGMYTSGK